MNRGMEEQESHELGDDVYSGDVPEDAYMESDFDQSAENQAVEDSKAEELESMKKRLQEIEEKAGALREMQAKVEKEMGAVQEDPAGVSAIQAEKEEVDSRSIYVGNVDYACTPEEVRQHFQSCGTVNRVTILMDKFGQPKGFAYVEFVEIKAVQNAVLLNESELHGRQLKVSAKRTNVPGMKQYRGRHPNPHFGSRTPFMPGRGMKVNTLPRSSQTSNATESETQESTGRKRLRKSSKSKPPMAPKQPRSIIWEHYEKGERKLSNGSEQQIGICKYCKAEIPAVYGSTSGLKNHLVKRCKSSPLYETNENDKSQTTLTNETIGQGSALVLHTYNQKRCELKLARYVIVDEVSFRAVEGKGFVELLHELQPRFRIPDRKKVASMIYDLFLLEKAKIQSVIGDQRISITTDTWTSIQNINYMVVTAHFLDSDWKLHKRIINFTKITSHAGEEIGKMIEVCLREWGIEKVFSVVVDNASSNDTTIDYLKRRMKSENSLLFEGKYLHLRCACHILNLIVKDGLKELNVSIKAIRNAVVFIHSSPSRLNKFREFAMLAKFSSTSTVPMDVKTRWNATYKMLEVALKYRRVFERMAEELLPFMNYFREKDEKGKERMGPPIADDWENAKAFVHFLKKFYDATLELSASKSPTSQLIYQSMIALQVEIERKRIDDSDPTLQKVACAMKLKFDKYWGNWDDMNPLIFIGNILDPRNKLQMIKVSVKKFEGTPTRIQEFVDKVKQYLVTLWMEYKGINDILNVESQSMQIECDGGDSGTSGGGGGLCDELFDDVEAQNEEEQLQEIYNEVDKYLADDIEKRSNQSFNLLEWWRGSETRYPILSIIAKDIFAIPCSTVASESAFSLGKRVVDPFRSSLSPKMVEALVCTSDWLRAEEFSFWKDPTEDDLELYKEIEEIEKNRASTTCSTSASTLVELEERAPRFRRSTRYGPY